MRDQQKSEDQLTKNGAESQTKIDVFVTSLRGQIVNNGTETLYAFLKISPSGTNSYVGTKREGVVDGIGKSTLDKIISYLKIFLLSGLVVFFLLVISGLIDVGKMKKIICKITDSNEINLGIFNYKCKD